MDNESADSARRRSQEHSAHTGLGAAATGKKTRNIPDPKHVHHRYFENPFHSYAGLPLRNPTEYLDDALGLFRDVYHYYSGVNLQTTRTDIYTGAAGAAFACARLLSMPDILTQADRQMAVKLGTRILDAALQQPNDEEGFLIGKPGVFCVAALFYAAAGDHRKADDCLTAYAKLCSHVEGLKVEDSSGDELFAGRIGYLDGFLELWKIFPSHKTLLQIDVGKIVAAIIRSGMHYSRKKGLEDQCPLFFYHYGSDYLGAAHGVSVILQILLCFPRILQNLEGAMEKVKKSVDYVLQQKTESGNFPPKFGDREEREELVHWCHGAAGVIYMLAKAYLIWNEKKYLDAAAVCADLIWQKGLLRKGPGICHGISGNGYAFLLMYRLTEKTDYLYRAHCFADFCFQPSVQDKSRTPDNPYSCKIRHADFGTSANDSLNGVLGDIATGKAEMGISAYSINSERAKYFDIVPSSFSRFYEVVIHERNTFYDNSTPLLQSLIGLFAPSIWLVFVTIFLLFTFLLAVSNVLQGKIKGGNASFAYGLKKWSLELLGSAIATGDIEVRLPSTISSQLFLVGVWLGWTVVIYFLFVSQLPAVLTTGQLKQMPFRTVEELAASGFTVYGTPYIKSLLEVHHKPAYRAVGAGVIAISDLPPSQYNEFLVKKLESGRVAAILSSDTHYELADYSCGLVIVIPKVASSLISGMIFPKNSPLRSSFVKEFELQYQSGLPMKDRGFYQHLSMENRTQRCVPQPFTTEVKSSFNHLSAADISFIIVIWFCGLVCAALLLGVENIVYRMR